MEKSHTYLIEDTLVEIFLRLPIKSLVRFRSVCKSWYRIISSSSFVKSQRNAVPKPNNVYLLCEYAYSYALMCEEKSSTNDRKYCYTPELFGINKKIKLNFTGVRIHGSCKGLLCVSDKVLYINSLIYLWNPFIRRAKRIPKIPVECYEQREWIWANNASLCFGYFDDDYKVISIAPFKGNYCVGVYSLSTDSWKITYCDSKYERFNSWDIYPSSRCVGGVAYLMKYKGRVVCFDLHDERIREVQLPEQFDPCYNRHNLFFMEAWGDSICFIGVRDGNLVQWVLRNSSWEKKLTVDLKGASCYPLGFTCSDKYVLRTDARRNGYYLWDFAISELHDFTICDDKGELMYAIDYLVGNLALLDEETIEPFVEMEPACSVQTRFVLYKNGLPRKRRRKTKLLHEAQNKLQGSRTKRKIEEI